MTQFLIIFICLLFFNYYIMKTFFPPEQGGKKETDSIAQVEEKIQSQELEPVEPQATAPVESEKPTENAAESTPAAKPAEPVAEPVAVEEPAEEILTLGSADAKSPYRMLVTLTNRGAAVACVEMNEKRLESMSSGPDFKGGYLGVLNIQKEPQDLAEEVQAAENVGVLVQVVGQGTPARQAGLQVGDRILRVDETEVFTFSQLREVVRCRKPGTEVTLGVLRTGSEKEEKIPVVLTREPAEIIRPENGDPLSFLTTLSKFGKLSLDSPHAEIGDRIATTDAEGLQNYLNLELPGIAMRSRCWEVESRTEESVTFLHRIPHYGLEIRKTYTLAQTPEQERENEIYKSYHLTFQIQVKNIGTMERSLAIQQDGPNGLPTEGYWFCSKVSRKWFQMVGIRDIIIGFADASTPTTVACTDIAKGNWGVYELNETRPVKYLGVDAQYFSSILIPSAEAGNAGIKQYTTLRSGNVPDPWVITTNTSCRVRCNEKTLQPGESASQEFTIFLGPKRPELLSQYSLDNVVYYGWFSWIAVLLSGILHFFYSFVGNYGIAIILLTILVRVLMFPLSKKQVMGALIMQKLQPEMKKIQEKFEDPMERQRAQMELFRKHNYNPMTGCWVMFIQLPIFIALYRSLLVDVELRQAPLFSEAIRFCSNLAAPDMLFNWTDYVWTTISTGYGFFGLGPYLNLLPILTIAIFIAQQKMFMPPALDDQARMQQNIMKYMMIFMGFVFFKVPSGLCIYFIISSLWGLAERQLMPKVEHLETVPGVVDITARPVEKKESFSQKIARLAGQKQEVKETPMERNRRRKRK